MGLQPLRLKRKATPNATSIQDEDEVPIRQDGPTIPGPVSVNIRTHKRTMPRLCAWYIKPPPAPDLEYDENNPDALPPGIVPQIQNLVCTFNVGCPLDVKKIPAIAINAEYNPQHFSACIIRIRIPKATGLLFPNGKVVVTGTCHKEDSIAASKKFVQILKEGGYNAAKFQGHTLQNVVATCNFKFGIQLQRLLDDSTWKDFMKFDSEGQFPGVTFKMPNPKICFLIFKSGHIVSTGIKEMSLTRKGFERIYKIVEKYKLPKPGPEEFDFVRKKKLARFQP